jgi:hypothetical protein
MGWPLVMAKKLTMKEAIAKSGHRAGPFFDHYRDREIAGMKI